jgi:hypothetical protein
VCIIDRVCTDRRGREDFLGFGLILGEYRGGRRGGDRGLIVSDFVA